MDSGPGQWQVIVGSLDISWVLSVLDYSVSSCGHSFGPCPKKEEQNEFPLGEVKSPLSVRCWGGWGCSVFFPAVLSFLAVPRALVGLAVVLGTVKGFHLEAPASQGRGERVCPTLAEAQQAQCRPGGSLGSGHQLGRPRVRGTGMCWERALLSGASLSRAVQGTVRAPGSPEEQGGGADTC